MSRSPGLTPAAKNSGSHKASRKHKCPPPTVINTFTRNNFLFFTFSPPLSSPGCWYCDILSVAGSGSIFRLPVRVRCWVAAWDTGVWTWILRWPGTSEKTETLKIYHIFDEGRLCAMLHCKIGDRAVTNSRLFIQTINAIMSFIFVHNFTVLCPYFLASAVSGECNNNMHRSLTQQYAKTRNGEEGRNNVNNTYSRLWSNFLLGLL